MPKLDYLFFETPCILLKDAVRIMVHSMITSRLVLMLVYTGYQIVTWTVCGSEKGNRVQKFCYSCLNISKELQQSLISKICFAYKDLLKNPLDEVLEDPPQYYGTIYTRQFET